MLLITLVACRSIQNEGGLDWVTVDFSIAELKQSSAHYAVSSSSIQTAFIIAVPENITSITVSDYLTRYYDRQLQDLTNNTVKLKIPLNMPLRLAKVVFKDVCELDEICSYQPTAFCAGISEVFSVNGSEESKTVAITMDTSLYSKTITSFSFKAESNSALSADVEGTINGTGISLTVPYETNVSDLVATFTSTGQSVTEGSSAQTSSTTANDFTDALTFTVTAADGTTQDYVVTVTTASAGVSINTASAVVSINAPTTLSYLTTSATYTYGTAISANTPIVDQACGSWIVSPDLPDGLSLNSTTGTISGTPSDQQIEANNYTITASNSAGSTSTTISIKVWGYITLSTGQNASVAIGQADFTSSVSGTSATTMIDVVYGNPAINNGTLYLPDTFNHRVLGYNAIPSTNGAAADFVLGQADMTSNGAGISATTFDNPQTVVFNGTQLFVTDLSNNRVLIYNDIPVTTQPAADVAVGAVDLDTSGVGGCTADEIDFPESIFATRDKLLRVRK